MGRSDISPNLIHFTSGADHEAAFTCLKKIISEGKLIGSARLIKGGYKCVCFSEAPLIHLTNGLVNPDDYSRYSAFGIMVSKKWLFSQGGRPVIYQTEDEYGLLPEGSRWRHMLYEIRDGHAPSDFSWEREWRIPCEYLEIDCQTAQIVVPDNEWAERLKREHDTEQDYRINSYSAVFDQIIAELYREEFCWNIATLA